MPPPPPVVPAAGARPAAPGGGRRAAADDRRSARRSPRSRSAPSGGLQLQPITTVGDRPRPRRRRPVRRSRSLFGRSGRRAWGARDARAAGRVHRPHGPLDRLGDRAVRRVGRGEPDDHRVRDARLGHRARAPGPGPLARRCSAASSSPALLVSGYALLTKIFPAWLAEDETYGRLREPFEYWNAVGLTAALGLPPAIWLGARRDGHAGLAALAYPASGVLVLTILLAYSRGVAARRRRRPRRVVRRRAAAPALGDRAAAERPGRRDRRLVGLRPGRPEQGPDPARDPLQRRHRAGRARRRPRASCCCSRASRRRGCATAACASARTQARLGHRVARRARARPRRDRGRARDDRPRPGRQHLARLEQPHRPEREHARATTRAA